MRIVVLCVLVGLVGCAGPRKETSSTHQNAPVVTPDFKPVGKIVMFNDQARFAVVNFPLGQLPQPDHRLDVYHKGSKVGELRATTEQKANNVIADLLVGSAQAEDEVRAQ
jgi:hypothetical protein